MAKRWGWFVLVAMLAAGCGDDDGAGPEPGVVPEAELVFARFGSGVAGRVETEGSFWAVRGQGRKLILRYLPVAGDEDEGEEFLTFEVPGDGLLRSPEGRLYQAGDSVRITVRVDTGGRMLFDFQPSGLRFDPEHPARLEVEYGEAEDDVDDDGDDDGDDRALRASFAIWRQERVGLPWESIGTVRIEELEELKAEIRGFTGFAVATRSAN